MTHVFSEIFFGKIMKTWKHEKDECFERGLDFNKKIRKNIKQQTHLEARKRRMFRARY